MAFAILPAAGSSRRMGRPKLLLPYGRSTILGSLIDSLQGAGLDLVVLVVARGDRTLTAWGLERGLEVVTNPEPERGMLSSLLEALRALGGAEQVARRGEPLVVSPADLPAVRSETVARVVAALDSHRALLALPTYRGRRGHPLALAPHIVAEIPTLDLAVGLRQLRDRHRSEVEEVEVDDPGVVLDVDTPEDYRALVDKQSPLSG